MNTYAAAIARSEAVNALGTMLREWQGHPAMLAAVESLIDHVEAWEPPAPTTDPHTAK